MQQQKKEEMGGKKYVHDSMWRLTFGKSKTNNQDIIRSISKAITRGISIIFG